jgi:hypothetical protein
MALPCLFLMMQNTNSPYSGNPKALITPILANPKSHFPTMQRNKTTAVFSSELEALSWNNPL